MFWKGEVGWLVGYYTGHLIYLLGMKLINFGYIFFLYFLVDMAKFL